MDEVKEEKPKKVVISRATWVRGTHALGPGNRTYDERGSSMLLNDKGHRCCLGFVGQQLCGVTDEEAKVSYYPSGGRVVQKFRRHLPELFSGYVISEETQRDLSTVCNTILRINDNNTIKGDRREKELIELFKSIDVEIEFVD